MTARRRPNNTACAFGPDRLRRLPTLTSAASLMEEHDVHGWWAQSISVW